MPIKPLLKGARNTSIKVQTQVLRLRKSKKSRKIGQVSLKVRFPIRKLKFSSN